MPEEQARRSLAAAQPEYVRNSTIYSRLDNCLVRLTQPFIAAADNDVDWVAKARRMGADKWFHQANSF